MLLAVGSDGIGLSYAMIVEAATFIAQVVQAAVLAGNAKLAFGCLGAMSAKALIQGPDGPH